MPTRQVLLHLAENLVFFLFSFLCNYICNLICRVQTNKLCRPSDTLSGQIRSRVPTRTKVPRCALSAIYIYLKQVLNSSPQVRLNTDTITHTNTESIVEFEICFHLHIEWQLAKKRERDRHTDNTRYHTIQQHQYRSIQIMVTCSWHYQPNDVIL